MAKEIIWTTRANIRFNSIIEYLETEWGEKVTENFVVRTYAIIDLLSIYPEIGSVEHSEKMIRGFAITKHNRLFYRVTKKEIIILNFFDNRRNIKRKKL
jgi:plasmid stabilization system protein ParE